MNATCPLRVSSDDLDRPLHDAAASRRIESLAAAALPPHTLMARAGLAVARLALALAPSARRIWIAAGPGNNGGDGFEAACQLHRAGMPVTVAWQGDPARLPPDAQRSYAGAVAAQVPFIASLPLAGAADLVIDALLGLGASRPPDAAMAAAIDTINRSPGLRLAVDLPTGLAGDTGATLGGAVVRATHTLSLLTLKPGLFTAQGRDHAGKVWFDPLAVDPSALGMAPSAWLGGAQAWRTAHVPRPHGGHKGRFGDVIVVGGAPGMAGAALLAARAALAAGAGRVFVCALDDTLPALDTARPELMWRPAAWSQSPAVLADATVVCGCGGGEAVKPVLPALLSRAPRLVLDADALNAIGADVALQTMLHARADRGQATVLTPHPLEAARLLGHGDAGAVQADRCAAAAGLASRWRCTVLLKGSGSVITAAGQPPCINPSGHARLATAGTGDVLAGWLAGLWSAAGASVGAPSVPQIAQAAAWSHGRAAQAGDPASPLPASELVARLAALDD